MPVTIDMDKTKAIKKFEKFMHSKDEGDFESLGTPEFYRVDGTWSSYIIHYTKEKGVTAFMEFSQDVVNFKNRILKIITQSDTINDKKIVKGFTLQAFKDLSKKYKRPIMIDNKNSSDMEFIFKLWIVTPEKYGIKNFYVYDHKLKKVLFDGNELEQPVWDSTPQSNRYSLIFDFFDYLKESIVENHDNLALSRTKLDFKDVNHPALKDGG